MQRQIKYDFGISPGKTLVATAIKEIYSEKYPSLTASKIFIEEMKIKINNLVAEGCTTIMSLLSHLPGFESDTDRKGRNLEVFILVNMGGITNVVERINPRPDYWHLAVDLIGSRGSLTRAQGILSAEFPEACGFKPTIKGFKSRFSGLSWTELKRFILTGLLPDRFGHRKAEFDAYLE